MLRYLKTAFQLVAMVVVFFVALAITVRLALHAGEVRIPDLSGMTVAEASDAALHGGLDLNIQNRFYSTTVPAGRIVSQAPAPGSEVRKGWQVRVIESLGPQEVTIPNVVGEPLREASMDLRRDQLDLGTLARMAAPGDQDLVLAQTPPPDAGVDQPRVNLLLSSSAADANSSFVMPSFAGMSFTNANREAIALGLRVATIGGVPLTPQPAPTTPMIVTGPNGQPVAVLTPPPAPPTPSGPVLTQSPEAGHRAGRGGVIRLYFWRPTPSPSTTPAPGSSGAVVSTGVTASPQ